MSGFDILLQAADQQSHDADNNNTIGDTANEVVASTTNGSQAGSLYANYISSSSSSNNLPPKKRIKLTNNHSTTCSIDGLISNATSNFNSTHTNNSTSNCNSTSTLKKTKSWNNSTYIQFRTSNNLTNNNWDNDSMSVSTIGMRSVSSCNNTSSSHGGIGVRGLSSHLGKRDVAANISSSYLSKKNEVWNTFSSPDSPTLISNDNNNNSKMLRREGSRSEGSSLHQLYNMNLVIPASKKQKMKQSTSRSYKRGLDKDLGKGGSSSCTDVNGIEMGLGYFSSSLSTRATSSAALFLDPQERGGKKRKRSRTEVVEVPQEEEDSTAGTKEEVPQDANCAAKSSTDKVTQEQGQGKAKRSSPQEEEGSAILVNVSTPPSKLNNNELMNENAKYLIAKSQLYRAYLQALNNHQD